MDGTGNLADLIWTYATVTSGRVYNIGSCEFKLIYTGKNLFYNLFYNKVKTAIKTDKWIIAEAT